MKILFVNAHRKLYNQNSKFHQFYSQIITILKNTIYFGNDIQQTIKNYQQLSSILYQQHSSFHDQNALKRFLLFDFIFIDGDTNTRPWIQQLAQVMIIIRMSIRYNIKCFMNGFAFIGLYYYQSTKFQSFRNIGKNNEDIQINPNNGDMRYKNKIIGNCGIHNKKYADQSKQFTSKVLGSIQKKQIILPTKFHNICFAKVAGHQLFKNINFPFSFFQTCTWMPNPIQYIKSNKIKVLAQTQNKLPLVIQLNQCLATLTINSNFFQILKNWLQKFCDRKNHPSNIKLNRMNTAENLISSNQRYLLIQQNKSHDRPYTAKMRTYTTNSNNNSRRLATKKSTEFEAPCIRCSGPYLTRQQLYKLKQREQEQKNISKRYMNYKKDKEEQNVIKNYVTRTPSQPPLLHKFREVEKKKWLSKKPFMVF